MLQILPIILSDRHYIDDFGRVTGGSLSMYQGGRPLADALLAILNLGVPLTDLAPLPLIVATVFLGLTSLLLARIATGVPKFVAAAAGCMIFLSPFYIENLSYRFDAATMAASVAFAAMAALHERNGWIGAVLRIVLLVVALCFYQASATMFPILALALMVKGYLCGEEDRRLVLSLARDAALFAAAYILYSQLIAAPLVGGDYGSIRSVMIPISLAGLSLFSENVISGFAYVYSSFNGATLAVLTFLFLLAQANLLLLSWQAAVNGRGALRFAVSALLAIALPSAFLLSFAHLAVLQDPGFVPRTLLAFGGSLFLAVWMACHLVERIRTRLLTNHSWTHWASSALAAVVVSCFLIHTYAFGNAQAAQRDWEQRLAYRLIDDLHELDPHGELGLVIVGGMGLAPGAIAQVRKFPLLERLVPVVLSGRWYHGYAMLRMYGMDRSLPSPGHWSSAHDAATGREPSASRAYYDLVVLENDVVVVF